MNDGETTCASTLQEKMWAVKEVLQTPLLLRQVAASRSHGDNPSTMTARYVAPMNRC